MDLPLQAFLLGFLGGLHCLGMCGGLAAAVGSLPGGRRRFLLHYGLYQGGKAWTYVFLGALAGHLGERAGALAGSAVARTAWVLAALVLAAAALRFLGLALPAAARFRLPPGLGSLLGRLRRGLASLPPAAAALGTGLVNGFLPCGLTGAALLLAAAAGGAARGALLLLAFGLGTVPWLLLPALGAWRGAGLQTPWLRRAAGLLLLGLAGLSLLRAAAPAPEAGCPACAEEKRKDAPLAGAPDPG